MRTSEGQNSSKIEIFNKKLKNREESQNTKKDVKKEASDHLAHNRSIDFAAGSPQGPPSRARGILDKSSNERIKQRRIDLWMRRGM